MKMTVSPQTFCARNAFFTLLKKEIIRFKKVAFHTIAAPVLSSLLYLIVFGTALEERVPTTTQTPYLNFLAPGLVIMAVLQNAFANSSSSFVQSKISGTLTFLLITPLSNTQIAAAYVLSATLRGLIVGFCVWLGTSLWIAPSLHSIVWIFSFALLGAFIMATLGLITAIWADRYEQMGVIQTFFIMPLTFLSGVFYSCETLPNPWRELAAFNPLYYIIDGFRGGFLGHFETNPLVACVWGMSVTIVVFLASIWLLKVGYKIKN